MQKRMLDDRIHDAHPNEHEVTALVRRLRCHEWMVIVDEDVDGVVLSRLTEVIGIPVRHVLRMVDTEGPWPYFDDAWFDLLRAQPCCFGLDNRWIGLVGNFHDLNNFDLFG